MSIGENIRKIRKEKGLTQKQLSKISGVHEIQLARYENGKTNPTLETIRKIANGLDVYVSEIVGDYWNSLSQDEIEKDLSKKYPLDKIFDLVMEKVDKDYDEELHKRGLYLMSELITTIFKQSGKYPHILNDIDGFNIANNKHLKEYKILTNEELKQIEKEILDYLDFLLEKALKDKEIHKK